MATFSLHTVLQCCSCPHLSARLKLYHIWFCKKIWTAAEKVLLPLIRDYVIKLFSLYQQPHVRGSNILQHVIVLNAEGRTISSKTTLLYSFILQQARVRGSNVVLRVSGENLGGSQPALPHDVRRGPGQASLRFRRERLQERVRDANDQLRVSDLFIPTLFDMSNILLTNFYPNLI